MQRYNFSEHPKTEHFIIGLTDASMTFHAYKIFLISVLQDSDTTRFHLLSSSTKINKVLDRTILFYELTRLVETLVEIRKLMEYFKLKNFHILPDNIRILIDSECWVIWSRVIKSRFKIGIQTLITKIFKFYLT